MKKILLLGFVLLAGISTLPAIASAQTTTQMTTQEQLNLIAQLTAQIQTLQQQLQQLQTQQRSNIITLVNSLGQGSSGQQVSALQAILAADPTVYPEGLITGYYGPLTAQAVKRFQAKHGIQQAGVVGPKTREAINAFLKDNPLAFESEDNTTTTTSTTSTVGRLCAVVPPGHLIAPGWLRKHDGEIPVIPTCQTIPPGIQQQLSDDRERGTVISNVAAAGITTSSADITWATNHLATSYVWMSAATPINTSATPTASSAQYVHAHDLTVTGLSAGTTYYYMVGSQDQGGGHMILAGPFSFSTTSGQDVTAPIISNLAANTTASAATITWQTNENANGTVWYGTSTPVTTSTATSTGSATLVQNHSIALTGLNPATTYYALVTSADASGNTATSSQFSFVTASATDTTPPTLSNIIASPVTATSATLLWQTNEPATSLVWYSTSTPVVTTTAQTATSGTLVLAHSIALNGLAPNTTYYYIIASADASGNTAQSGQFSFATPAAPDTTPPTLLSISATAITSSTAHLTWSTNEPATSLVWYSTSTPVLTTSAPGASNATLVINHDIAIGGLTASSTYYYVVGSADAAGNIATSTEQSLVTPSL